jgi:hypothetical protein
MHFVAARRLLENPPSQSSWLLVAGRLHVFRRASTRLSCAAILSLDRIVHFLAMHRDTLGGFDTQADFVTANVNNRHNDVVANHDAFVAVSGKDEHNALKVIQDVYG